MPEGGTTKLALAGAMKALMSEQPFQKITVGDICERCGMNRKSFYYHFLDKYDLVNWIYYTEFVETVTKEALSTPWALSEAVCAYLYENRRFYANALTITGPNSFSEYFASLLRPLIEFQIPPRTSEDAENAAFTETFISDAFIVSLRRWLTENPVTPPEIYMKRVRRMIALFGEAYRRDAEKEQPTG